MRVHRETRSESPTMLEVQLLDRNINPNHSGVSPGNSPARLYEREAKHNYRNSGFSQVLISHEFVGGTKSGITGPRWAFGYTTGLCYAQDES